MTDLLQAFDWADTPASEDVLERVQSEFGPLPHEYVTLMRRHDGGEGFVGEGSYLRLWAAGDLFEKNSTLAPQRPKNVVLLGSDGADDLFGVALSSQGYRFLGFPRIELVREGKLLGDSWDAFLEALSRI